MSGIVLGPWKVKRGGVEPFDSGKFVKLEELDSAEGTWGISVSRKKQGPFSRKATLSELVSESVWHGPLDNKPGFQLFVLLLPHPSPKKRTMVGVRWFGSELGVQDGLPGPGQPLQGTWGAEEG